MILSEEKIKKLKKEFIQILSIIQKIKKLILKKLEKNLLI